MQHSPKISVLISTYDDRSYVSKKLAEIQSQSVFSDIEFIFLETGSPGREREELAPFCALNLNCKLITTDERLTLYEAWNLGWKSASAPYVCISNMDDTMHPRLLEYVIRGLDENDWDIATVLIGKQQLEDPQLNSWDIDRLQKLDLQERPGAFFVWRNSLLDTFGPFDSTFRIAGDKDFWARAVDQNLSMGYVPHLLYLYTKHPNQLSKSPKFQALKDADHAYLKTKPYPHVWPKKIVSSIRRTEKLGRIPLMGNKNRFVRV